MTAVSKSRPCPITLAWSEVDRMVPAEPYGRVARELVPGASRMVLLGFGHDSMIDDPTWWRG
jgi:pimeloyl-ACP methyl ester carboxylesterase